MKKNTSFIHSSSIIDDDVEVGSGSKIWHWCHISKNATIGKNCILGQNTFVGPNVQIGDNCKIQNNVSIYEGLIISNNVFIGPSVVFTNVINPRALIERKQESSEDSIEESSETADGGAPEDVKVTEGKPKRKCPSVPAKNFDEGFVKQSEHDGRLYRVKTIKSGVKRWVINKS